MKPGNKAKPGSLFINNDGNFIKDAIPPRADRAKAIQSCQAVPNHKMCVDRAKALLAASMDTIFTK